MRAYLLPALLCATGGAFYGLTAVFVTLAAIMQDNFAITMAISCVCALFILFLAVATWGRSLRVIR